VVLPVQRRAAAEAVQVPNSGQVEKVLRWPTVVVVALAVVMLLESAVLTAGARLLEPLEKTVAVRPILLAEFLPEQRQEQRIPSTPSFAFRLIASPEAVELVAAEEPRAGPVVSVLAEVEQTLPQVYPELAASGAVLAALLLVDLLRLAVELVAVAVAVLVPVLQWAVTES
jgi:hypothetical protein